MRCKRKLSGGVCTLRQVEMTDCTLAYVDWLNDPEVNKYLETKWVVQDIGTIKEFVETQIEAPDSILFAILNPLGAHIGNIKIGPIHRHYKHADVSYFIGDKTEWNHGIATEAIRLACEYGFEELGLHRMEAGTYQNAVGSQRALEKNGFIKEAVLRKQCLFHNEWIDVYRYGLLSVDFKGESQKGKIHEDARDNTGK